MLKIVFINFSVKILKIINIQKTKTFLFLFFLFFSLYSAAQDNKFIVYGKFIVDDGNYNNSKIIILEDGKTWKSINGKRKFNYALSYNKVYIFSFQKDGYVTKKIKIDTHIPDNLADHFFPDYEFYVDVFKQYEGINTVVYNQPVGVIKYFSDKNEFSYDTDYTKSIRSQIDKVEKDTKKAEQEEEAKKIAEDQANQNDGEEAKNKAEEEARKKFEEKEKKKAEELAKWKLEGEAKKREEEAKRKAEDEAKKAALIKAEEEAKQKANEEEAKRRAKEEAEQNDREEAKKKAEQEAKKIFEEKEKKKIQELAQLKAEEETKKEEEEAKRKAREEAKKKAEEEAQVFESYMKIIQDKDIKREHIKKKIKDIYLVIIRQGGEIIIYRKMVYSFGIYHFRNNLNISDVVYDRETE